jgi:2-dehydro-3-deoxyphosphogluconate aldolase/(4S)-4-hydroxy-2-oxoglutarate aldolase
VTTIREILKLAPVIPVLTIENLEHAVPLAKALCNGGLRVLEVTLRTPIALDAVRAMIRAVPEAVVGVGTLTRADDFAQSRQAGARFAVSPGLIPDMIQAARESGLPLLPGVMTPSELMAARAAGFDSLKLFPASAAGGVALLRAFAAPFPDVIFCPTGGITRATARDYLALKNVACIGGSWMVPPELLAARDWAGVEALARDAANLRA